jgi:hypothetical protein
LQYINWFYATFIKLHLVDNVKPVTKYNEWYDSASIIKSFSVQYTLLVSESSLQSNTAKMGTIINMLTLLIKIGKYLLWIVLGFALLNLTLAILDFTVWNNIAVGVFNSILAFGGFVFFGQLSKRRTIRRYEYGYTTRHLSKL